MAPGRSIVGAPSRSEAGVARPQDSQAGRTIEQHLLSVAASLTRWRVEGGGGDEWRGIRVNANFRRRARNSDRISSWPQRPFAATARAQARGSRHLRSSRKRPSSVLAAQIRARAAKSCHEHGPHGAAHCGSPRPVGPVRIKVQRGAAIQSRPQVEERNCRQAQARHPVTGAPGVSVGTTPTAGRRSSCPPVSISHRFRYSAARDSS